MMIKSADIIILDTRSIPFWIPNRHTANPIMHMSTVQKVITGTIRPAYSKNPAVTSSVVAPANSPRMLR